MKSQQITIERETIEQIEAELETTADPTGGAVSWSFPALNVRPTSWVAGTWRGARGVGTQWKATTLSPLVGATGAAGTVNLTAGTYDVYVKLTVGTETPVLSVGTLTVR